MNLNFLSESIGRTVRLERGGPDKVVGKLLVISSDYLAVETERDKTVVYVNAQHIKTISEPIVPEVQMTRTTTEPELPEPLVEQPPLIEADNFRGILSKLETRMVRVNHGGPNALQGALMKSSPEYITILHDMKDYVHYPIYHVRSITWILNTQDSPQGEGNKSSQKGNEKDGSKQK